MNDDWTAKFWPGDEVMVGFYGLGQTHETDKPGIWKPGVVVGVRQEGATSAVLCAVPDEGYTEARPNVVLVPKRLRHIRRPPLPFKPSKIETIEKWLES